MARVNAAVELHQCLRRAYGPQPHWWPGDSPFEIMIGAILTQNTQWSNVETALTQLKQRNCLDPHTLAELPQAELQTAIRCSGYYRQKSQRIQRFCRWLIEQGGVTELTRIETTSLRNQLLSLNGIGPETADDILLYGLQRPVFVIDAYTRRLATRLGWHVEKESYDHWQSCFEAQLPKSVELFGEFHGLIVLHAKKHCNKKPNCSECCCRTICSFENILKS